VLSDKRRRKKDGQGNEDGDLKQTKSFIIGRGKKGGPGKVGKSGDLESWGPNWGENALKSITKRLMTQKKPRWGKKRGFRKSTFQRKSRGTVERNAEGEVGGGNHPKLTLRCLL